MTKTTYNEYGAEMIENRPTMHQLDLDEMTKAERKEYLSICDKVAESAYGYISSNDPELFPAFRSALHALFAFVGTETRILALDAYTTRFIPAVVPYKKVKSKAYKDAEKAARLFKRAKEWACTVSGIDSENPNAIIFPKASDTASAQIAYYNADIQDHYNAIITFFTVAKKAGQNLTLKVLTDELTRLEGVRDEIGAQPWQCYNDYKNPMLSSRGTVLSHVPESIRKGIEDTMADLLSQRELMTAAQLRKEEAQIKGGKKQVKQEKEQAK